MQMSPHSHGPSVSVMWLSCEMDVVVGCAQQGVLFDRTPASEQRLEHVDQIQCGFDLVL